MHTILHLTRHVETGHILVFCKLSTLAILPFLSFLCFNLGTIALFVWLILGFKYKIID